MFLCWRDERGRYQVRRIVSYCLSDTRHFRKFKRHVRGIYEWGLMELLKGIRGFLGELLEKMGECENC